MWIVATFVVVGDWQAIVVLMRPGISPVENATDQSTWIRRDEFSTGLSAPACQVNNLPAFNLTSLHVYFIALADCRMRRAHRQPQTVH